jgi:hypothetical protein
MRFRHFLTLLLLLVIFCGAFYLRATSAVVCSSAGYLLRGGEPVYENGQQLRCARLPMLGAADANAQ